MDNFFSRLGLLCAYLTAQLIMLFIILQSVSEVLHLISGHLTLVAIWVCSCTMYASHEAAHLLKNNILRGARHILQN